MTTPTLSLRQLNRTLLARQLLLERSPLPVPSAVSQLAGLQAQVQNPPYIGLWTRLQNFRRTELTRAMEAKQVVRATLMRSTIHLFTAEDYAHLRPALQPALSRALNGFFGARARALTPEPLIEAAWEFFRVQPHTFVELRAMLGEIAPDQDRDAMAYLIRTELPLVQVPPGGTWGYGGDVYYALSEQHSGHPLSTEETLPELIRRYLTAFGPASVADIQAWAGLTKLKETVQALRGELRVFKDEKGVDLFDLPDVPFPPEKTPAPVRFIPEYDNLVISHADRRRILPEPYRTRVLLSAGRVRATFLLDGMVAGTWKLERETQKTGRGAQKTTTATLVIEPFEPLRPQDEAELAEEGESLVRFVEDSAGQYEVEFRSSHLV
jgi:hypothetical protein